MINDISHDDRQRDSRLLAQVLEIGSSLHHSLDLNSLSQEIVQVVHRSLGFGAVVLNLVDEDSKRVRVYAYAGLDDEGRQLLEGAAYAWEDFANLLQEQFRVGHCYFVPHSEFDWERDFEGPVYRAVDDGVSGDDLDDRWHPDDSLFVPIQLRQGQTLGILSVDQPLDKRRPSPATLQALEILANQAAIAIENARLYQQARQEIGERKHMEEALKRFSRVVEQTTDPVVITNRDGIIEYVNPAFEKLTGYTKEDAIGQTPRIVKSGEHNQQFYEDLWRTILSGNSYRGVVVNRKKNGELFYEEKSITPLRDEHGNVTHFVSTGKDITERKAAEVERERLLTDLARRSTQLETAAEVSRAASSILNPDELIRQVVSLVRERFELYYTGLFLVDQTGEWTGEAGRWAVLRAGTGEAGRVQLERGHKLEIGGESMVGWCVANKQARIALDVGEEAVRFENPLLPETRSEMALPLIVRGQVIGAMTVQSVGEAAFSDEDIAVLQTMADQVAVAIENARLFEQAQVRAERERLVRTITNKVHQGADTEAIMRITLQELGQILGASQSIVRLGTRERLLSIQKTQAPKTKGD